MLFFLSEDPKCAVDSFNLDCFHSAFNDTVASNVLLVDDVVYTTNPEFRVTSSRIYIHYKYFMGDEAEVETRSRLVWLGQHKFGFGTDGLIIYSVVDVFFEQLEELGAQYIGLILLTVEALILISFLLIIDLKTIFLLTLVVGSFTISVLASMILIATKLNFIILMHFLMLPAFACDFFLTQSYLYLYMATAKNRTKSNRLGNEEKEVALPKVSKDNRRLKQLRFAYVNYTKHSAYFLLVIVFLSFFLVANFVSTYAFVMLYKFLLVTIFNLVLHQALIFPLLLGLFGSVWI